MSNLDGKRPAAWIPEDEPCNIAVLGKLAEECAELSKILARCLIQGVDESDPRTGKSNRAVLSEEVADVLACIDVLGNHFDMDADFIKNRTRSRRRFLEEWHALVAEHEKALMELNARAFGAGDVK
jgi:hypothetical protein